MKHVVTAGNFKSKVNQLRGSVEDSSNKITAVFPGKNDAKHRPWAKNKGSC